MCSCSKLRNSGASHQVPGASALRRWRSQRLRKRSNKLTRSASHAAGICWIFWVLMRDGAPVVLNLGTPEDIQDQPCPVLAGFDYQVHPAKCQSQAVQIRQQLLSIHTAPPTSHKSPGSPGSPGKGTENDSPFKCSATHR